MAPPKGSKRGPSTLSTVTNASGTTTPAKGPKTGRSSKVVKLKIPVEFLAKLQEKDNAAKGIISNASTAPAVKASSGVTLKLKTSASDTPSSKEGEADGSSSPDKSAVPVDSKDVKAGVKRGADALAADDLKPKPKGIQRKRLKVGENGKIDGRTSAAKALGYVASAHKPGPKANQGAINEKLRALDRTTKPCRKWGKAGFSLKSFTGQVWEIRTWNSPQTRCFGVENASSGSSNTKDSKEASSSNVGSDQSPAAAQADAPASSPITTPA